MSAAVRHRHWPGRSDVHKSFPVLLMLGTGGSQLARFTATGRGEGLSFSKSRKGL